MNVEDIKVGETYNVRVIVKYIEGYDVVAATIGQDGKEGYRTRFLFGDNKAFSPISPETAPKYDPCREYKEGDVVRYKPCNGREHKCFTDDEFFCERNLTVIAAEDSTSHNVMVMSQDGRTKIVEFCYLELITPVEEMEPYSVRVSDAFDIVRGGEIVMTIPFTEDDYYTFDQAEAAAETECDRLNAEWRKEMGK